MITSIKYGIRRNASALDVKVPADEKLAHPIPQVSLQLDPVVEHGAARAAGPLPLLREVLEKRGVSRQPEHHSHGLPAAAGLLHPQLCRRPRRHRLAGWFAATAAAFRLSALRTQRPGG
jgi:hypothetical protein